MAWYFGVTGGFSLTPPAAPVLSIPAAQFAFILMSLGILFKVGAIPMSAWIPDVYQGAPTPVTAFLSTCSKIAGVMALLLLCQSTLVAPSPFGGIVSATPVHYAEVVPALQAFFILVAIATLVIGNLSAINQSNAKRLLAYSSIGQAGFILVLFVPLIDESIGSYDVSQAFFVYLGAYAMAAVLAFIAIGVIRMARQSEEIAAFNGLGKTNPFFAFAIAVAMASLAGVPLTAGFVGKLMTFASIIAMSDLSYTLLAAMIFAAAVGFYYYFKILRAMYWEAPVEGDAPIKVPTLSAVLMGVLCVTILAVGFGFLAIV